MIGFGDAKHSGKLQLNSELTLEKTIAMESQSESVKLQQATVREEQKIAVNVELEMSFAIAMIKGGIFNLTVKHLLQILVQLVSREAVALLVF